MGRGGRGATTRAATTRAATGRGATTRAGTDRGTKAATTRADTDRGTKAATTRASRASTRPGTRSGAERTDETFGMTRSQKPGDPFEWHNVEWQRTFRAQRCPGVFRFRLFKRRRRKP